MAWTDAEEQRIETLEEVVNDLQTAASNLASKQQMQQMLLIKQAEIDALTERVAALESQVTVLQGTLT
jgi:polyhydroxyalkanoate synthesis regulator phasin